MKRHRSYTEHRFVLTLVAIALLSASSLAQSDEDCGFHAAHEMLLTKNIVDERPTLSGTEYVITTTHFEVHYTFEGTDATTQPWADSVAVDAEYCWATLQSLGWALPMVRSLFSNALSTCRGEGFPATGTSPPNLQDMAHQRNTRLILFFLIPPIASS